MQTPAREPVALLRFREGSPELRMDEREVRGSPARRRGCITDL
jgi:hypothetical protein